MCCCWYPYSMSWCCCYATSAMIQYLCYGLISCCRRYAKQWLPQFNVVLLVCYECHYPMSWCCYDAMSATIQYLGYGVMSCCRRYDIVCYAIFATIQCPAVGMLWMSLFNAIILWFAVTVLRMLWSDDLLLVCYECHYSMSWCCYDAMSTIIQCPAAVTVLPNAPIQCPGVDIITQCPVAVAMPRVQWFNTFAMA